MSSLGTRTNIRRGQPAITGGVTIKPESRYTIIPKDLFKPDSRTINPFSGNTGFQPATTIIPRNIFKPDMETPIEHTEDGTLIIPTDWLDRERRSFEQAKREEEALDINLMLAEGYAYRPMYFNPSSIHDPVEVQRLTNMMDRVKVNLISHQLDILEALERNQDELDELVALNPEVGRDGNYVIENVMDRVGKMIGSLSKDAAQQSILKQMRKRFSTYVSNYVTHKLSLIRQALPGSATIAEQLERFVVRGGESKFSSLLKDGNELLLILDIELELLNDGEYIAEQMTGRQDSILQKKYRDSFGVTWYDEHVPEWLKPVTDTLGFNEWRQTVSAASMLNELVGDGTENDYHRYTRLMTSIDAIKDQSDKFSFAHNKFLSDIVLQLSDMKKKTNNKRGVHRFADMVAQRYGGLSSSHVVNVSRTREWYKLVSGKSDAQLNINDNVNIGRIARVLDDWAR